MARQVPHREQKDKTMNSFLHSLKYLLSASGTVLVAVEFEIKRIWPKAPEELTVLMKENICRQTFPAMHYVIEVHSRTLGSTRRKHLCQGPRTNSRNNTSDR